MPLVMLTWVFSRVENWENFSLIPSVCTLVGAFLLWTLIEYLLHRFVFHSEYVLPDSKLLRYLHFALHGIHHMLPTDP